MDTCKSSNLALCDENMAHSGLVDALAVSELKEHEGRETRATRRETLDRESAEVSCEAIA